MNIKVVIPSLIERLTILQFVYCEVYLALDFCSGNSQLKAYIAIQQIYRLLSSFFQLKPCYNDDCQHMVASNLYSISIVNKTWILNFAVLT